VSRTILVFLCAGALASALQAARPYTPRAWFDDGTGLEIYTETGGSPELDPQGAIGIGPGTGSQDLVFRMVADRDNNILFAYGLEASHGSGPGTVMIRIEPISAAMEANWLKPNRDPRLPKFGGTHIPTVAGIREFPAVKIGEVVTLDVLYNPSTGVKIFDVLRPITDPSPATPGHTAVTSRPTRESMSLKNIVVRINGQEMPAPAAWMIGSAIRIDVPGRGAYVVAAYDPKDASPRHAFAAVAHADGKTLSWTIDGNYIEIASSTNVLTQALNSVLWVYHDARYRSQEQPDAVRLQAADTVDWLLPKR
jgi:hypothetical protein